jgi:hypothetical protein
MSQWSSSRISIAVLVTVTVAIAASTSAAQQSASAVVSLPDTAQVVNTLGGRVRVVPIKGLVYPWALDLINKIKIK